MSRKHLEEAIMIGQLIEHGLEPKFRFSNVESNRRILPVDDPVHEDVSVHCVQFNKDGQYVAFGAANSTIRVVGCRPPYKVKTIKASRHSHGFPITCLRFLNPTHDVLFGCSPSGEVYTMDIHREGFETVLTEDVETYCLDVSATGNELATAGRDLTIRLYDIIMTDGSQFNTLHPLKGFQHTAVDYNLTEGHWMRLFVLRYHPERHKMLVSAGWDDIVKIWDTRLDKGPCLRFNGPHICSSDSLDIRGDEILTASWRAKNALQVWDMRKLNNSTIDFSPVDTIPLVGKRWQSSPLDTEYLYGAKFCDNNTLIAGGSGFNSMRIINRITQEPVGEIVCDLPVQALDTIFGGRQLVAGSADGSVYLASMR